MCGEFRDIMTRSPTIPSRSSWVQTALQCLTRDVATVLVSLLSRSWGLLCPHLTSLLNMTSDFQNEKRKWSSLLRMIALWSLLSMLFMQAARAGGRLQCSDLRKKNRAQTLNFGTAADRTVILPMTLLLPQIFLSSITATSVKRPVPFGDKCCWKERRPNLSLTYGAQQLGCCSQYEIGCTQRKQAQSYILAHNLGYYPL